MFGEGGEFVRGKCCWFGKAVILVGKGGIVGFSDLVCLSMKLRLFRKKRLFVLVNLLVFL